MKSVEGVEAVASGEDAAASGRREFVSIQIWILIILCQGKISLSYKWEKIPSCYIKSHSSAVWLLRSLALLPIMSASSGKS